MIDLYSWATPNGHKVHIMLEELNLPYRVHAVDIGKGDQFEPGFLKISPNNKIPAIVDPDGPDGKPISVFETGAILIYLAENTASELLPKELRQRMQVLQWLMFQMGGLGPMLGQAHHFRVYAPEKIPYAYDRYTNEAARLYGVMDRRLGEAEFLGDSYSIADIACFPWIRSHERQGQDLNDFPNLKRWFETIRSRPAVQRGLEVLSDTSKNTPFNAKDNARLFGLKPSGSTK